jgi:hypothetical protein
MVSIFKDFNPLNHRYNEVLDILMMEPEMGETLFNNMKIWSISPSMRQGMIDLIESSQPYRDLQESVKTGLISQEKLDNVNNNAVYSNAILTIKCHSTMSQDFNHLTAGYTIRWVLVVHEYETGTLFNFETGEGILIHMGHNQHLTMADGCMVFYDTSSNIFQHMVVYGVQPVPEYNK